MTTRTGRGGGLALTGICLGFFLVLFDATAVNVATGGIARGLGASVITLQWVLNAYTVAFAALMLTAGSLGDRWGARRVYQGGAALFAVSSAVCAAAPNATTLVTARAVQGIGAAAVVPCSLALIAHRYPEPVARARALGIWGGVSGIGLTAGPVMGGWLVAALGWRSVFLVVVPVSAVSIALIAARTAEIPRHAATRPDLRGQLLAVASLVALTASLTMTSTLGWSSPLVLGLLAVAVALGACFVVAEHRVSEPMLPPALFRSSAFSGATGVGLLFNFGLYGVLFCITIFLERTLRQSAAVTGVCGPSQSRPLRAGISAKLMSLIPISRIAVLTPGRSSTSRRRSSRRSARMTPAFAWATRTSTTACASSRPASPASTSPRSARSTTSRCSAHAPTRTSSAGMT